MDFDERYDLVCQVGEEVITDEDLRQLLETHDTFVAYDGFEPSGNPHIAQGIIRAININKMTKAGAKFKMLVADIPKAMVNIIIMTSAFVLNPNQQANTPN